MPDDGTHLFFTLDPIHVADASQQSILSETDPRATNSSIRGKEKVETTALRVGKVVHIKDTAHRTYALNVSKLGRTKADGRARWEALVFYLYTSEISFASLRSNREGRRPDRKPSAKSMYRLADKVGCPLSSQAPF